MASAPAGRLVGQAHPLHRRLSARQRCPTWWPARCRPASRSPAPARGGGEPRRVTGMIAAEAVARAPNAPHLPGDLAVQMISAHHVAARLINPMAVRGAAAHELFLVSDGASLSAIPRVHGLRRRTRQLIAVAGTGNAPHVNTETLRAQCRHHRGAVLPRRLAGLVDLPGVSRSPSRPRCRFGDKRWFGAPGWLGSTTRRLLPIRPPSREWGWLTDAGTTQRLCGGLHAAGYVNWMNADHKLLGPVAAAHRH